MTETEQKKWKWGKPLLLTLCCIQQVIQWIVRIPLLVLWLTFYIPTQIIEHIADFLQEWIVNRPITTLASKLGLIDLYVKARKEQS